MLYEESEYKSKFPGKTIQNRVYIRLDGRFMIQPDVKAFPLYCTACRRKQPELYIHDGSRYGHVGACACSFCGAEINVNDGDNIVTFIRTGGREIDFADLYLIDWKYIHAMGEQEEMKILQALQSYKGRFVYLDELCDIVERTLELKVESTHSFCTDREYSILPADVNRWINLLHTAGVRLPEGVF